MTAIREAFQERLAEVEAYLAFLELMEAQAQSGPPRLDGADDPISTQQQKLLYASLYLHLYNLVEATVTLCVDSVARAAHGDGTRRPHDLSYDIRTEWVRSAARTHIDLTHDKRLMAANSLVNVLVEDRAIAPFDIERGGGGNWDDVQIEKLSRRLGCRLQIKRSVKAAVKRPIKDDRGALALVRATRNSLAHGAMSFTESAEQVAVSELRDLAKAVVRYLDEVVAHYEAYLGGHEYLVEHRRPAPVDGADQ